MSTGPSPQHEAATEVWALMQSFVGDHSPRHRLRERLGVGLAKGRSKVMALLMLADAPRSLAEIADAQRIDRPYATAIVDQLEALGLAERTADARDRRRKFVALTPSPFAIQLQLHMPLGQPQRVGDSPPQPVPRRGPQVDAAHMENLVVWPPRRVTAQGGETATS